MGERYIYSALIVSSALFFQNCAQDGFGGAGVSFSSTLQSVDQQDQQQDSEVNTVIPEAINPVVEIPPLQCPANVVSIHIDGTLINGPANADPRCVSNKCADLGLEIVRANGAKTNYKFSLSPYQGENDPATGEHFQWCVLGGRNLPKSIWEAFKGAIGATKDYQHFDTSGDHFYWLRNGYAESKLPTDSANLNSSGVLKSCANDLKWRVSTVGGKQVCLSGASKGGTMALLAVAETNGLTNCLSYKHDAKYYMYCYEGFTP